MSFEKVKLLIQSIPDIQVQLIYIQSLIDCYRYVDSKMEHTLTSDSGFAFFESIKILKKKKIVTSKTFLESMQFLCAYIPLISHELTEYKFYCIILKHISYYANKKVEELELEQSLITNTFVDVMNNISNARNRNSYRKIVKRYSSNLDFVIPEIQKRFKPNDDSSSDEEYEDETSDDSSDDQTVSSDDEAETSNEAEENCSITKSVNLSEITSVFNK